MITSYVLKYCFARQYFVVHVLLACMHNNFVCCLKPRIILYSTTILGHLSASNTVRTCSFSTELISGCDHTDHTSRNVRHRPLELNKRTEPSSTHTDSHEYLCVSSCEWWL